MSINSPSESGSPPRARSAPAAEAAPPADVRIPGRAETVAVLVGLCLSAAALAAAPALMPAKYSWVSQTTSESAAQGLHGAWLARLGFLLFGLSVMALASTGTPQWGRWSAAFHYVFGACMTGAAAFSLKSWTGGPYDHTEDTLHSVMASLMGIAFAAGVVAAALHARRSARRGRVLLDAVAVAASVAAPVAMSMLPGLDGAVQRAMFLVAYVWYAVAAVRILRTTPV